MRIGVVSDTHGHTRNTQAAVRMLSALEVQAVLHCGDIGSPDVISLFEPWPTHFVLGNVDDDEAWFRAEAEACGQTLHGRFAQVELAGVPIAFLHGDDGRRLNETIQSGRHRLVCHGHTHEVRQEQIGTTLVLNPGALFRARRLTLAIVDLPELQVEIIGVA